MVSAALHASGRLWVPDAIQDISDDASIKGQPISLFTTVLQYTTEYTQAAGQDEAAAAGDAWEAREAATLPGCCWQQQEAAGRYPPHHC